MRNKVLKIVWMFILLTVFIMPQTLKTFHIFNFHHGHLDCHLSHKYQNGINPVDEHCPVCKLVFTFYGIEEYKNVVLVSDGKTALFSEKLITIHTGSHSYNYQLRAPPAA